MERVLRPDKLELDIVKSANGTNSAVFIHWRKTVENFLDSMKTTVNTEQAKYQVLINYVSPDAYQHISSLTECTAALNHLQTLFVKAKNENYARHCLVSRVQKSEESVEQYLIALSNMAKDCDFKAVSAQGHMDEFVRTSFISGLKSNPIRQRLLEETKSLTDTVKLALTLEQALRDSEQFQHVENSASGHLAVLPESIQPPVLASTFSHHHQPSNNAGGRSNNGGGRSCEFCGLSRHMRRDCPAREQTCGKCGKQGHYGRVCRSSKVHGSTQQRRSAATHRPGYYSNDDTESSHVSSDHGGAPDMGTHYTPHLAALSSYRYPSSLSTAVTNVKVNQTFNAHLLIDTGSSESFINKNFVDKLDVDVLPCRNIIAMASESHVSETLGKCSVSILLNGQCLENVQLMVIKDLCCDIILGHDVLRKHGKLVMNFDGPLPRIELPGPHKTICTLYPAKIEPPSLFSNLLDTIRPIACPSRKFSGPESSFIKKTIDELISDNIVRTSNSPWRAQVLVVGLNKPHTKPRMVVDYSRTINKFTELDAYPLPAIDTLVNKIAKHKVYSTYDLKSAYYQVPLREEEKCYTAFEAGGKLLEFNVIPFGVKNGVAAFQRVIDDIIHIEKLDGTYAYLDNITVAGDDQFQHDQNVRRFMEVVKKHRFTLNEEKTIRSVSSINILGYLVSHNTIKPDPERMEPLLKLPLPSDPAALKRALGLFSYYSRWIDKFSDRIQPLIGDPDFPLSEDCKNAFEEIKLSIVNASVVNPSDSEILVLETDASDLALSASLNQGGKPVAFFSRTLKAHERKHPAVEKEACAIVEACRKWNHYLAGRRFLLITDQQAVFYMFSRENHGKIKNDKILRWRIELSTLEFDIKFRPGPENVTADCLSRAYCSALPANLLNKLHQDLCHPGIARLHHFVRSKNLPYTLAEIKAVTSQCEICAKIKPQFLRPTNPPLIEATKPLDRISIDFKGPLPSSTKNKYFLTVIDEYSRFPFVFPCSDMESSTMIRCLTDIFSVFGIAGFVHSDNGPSLISSELRYFLRDHGVNYSNSSKYNPRGNSQVERYNGVIWKSIQLSLASKNLPITCWELVIPEVLHCQRTLLCTATNKTPHERMFAFERRSANGTSLPSWLLESDKVLVKRHVRRSKYEPLCDEVDLVSINPSHAKVRYAGGREDTVALRHLAPLPPHKNPASHPDTNTPPPPTGPAVMDPAAERERTDFGPHLAPPALTPSDHVPVSSEPHLPPPQSSVTLPPRRSKRESRPPDRFQAG